MQVFRKARKIINQQIPSREHRHYPFRVATNYRKFMQVYGGRFSAEQSQEVLRSVNFVHEKAGEFLHSNPEQHKFTRYVRDCHTAMESVLVDTAATSAETNRPDQGSPQLSAVPRHRKKGPR